MDQWRDIAFNATRTGDIQWSGVVRDDLSKTLSNTIFSAVYNGTPVRAKIVDSDGNFISGNFLISANERSGEHNGNEMYTLTLTSTGDFGLPDVPPDPFAYLLDEITVYPLTSDFLPLPGCVNRFTQYADGRLTPSGTVIIGSSGTQIGSGGSSASLRASFVSYTGVSEFTYGMFSNLRNPSSGSNDSFLLSHTLQCASSLQHTFNFLQNKMRWDASSIVIGPSIAASTAGRSQILVRSSGVESIYVDGAIYTGGSKSATPTTYFGLFLSSFPTIKVNTVARDLFYIPRACTQAEITYLATKRW